MGYVLSFLP